MTQHKWNQLVAYLTEAARELYADHDLGFPNTFDDFERAMWQDDDDMKKWAATREEYRDALRAAWSERSENVL